MVNIATTILLAENHPETRELFDIAFRRMGLLPVTTEDGAGAMAAYWEALYHMRPLRLIWLDLAMPRIDGLTVAKRIREAERRVEARVSLAAEYGYPPPSEVPPAYIIGCTAHVDLEKDREQFTSVFDEMLEKPVNFDEVQNVINRGLTSTGASLLEEKGNQQQ